MQLIERDKAISPSICPLPNYTSLVEVLVQNTPGKIKPIAHLVLREQYLVSRRKD